MFAKRTVFIIGAGASAEFGMPTGGALQGLIADRLNFGFDGENETGDRKLLQHLAKQWSATRVESYAKRGFALAKLIKKFPSIDEALHFHSDDLEMVTIGKIAIANEIIKAERDSYLYGGIAGDGGQKQRCSAAWASQFLMISLSASRRVDIEHVFQNVAIINFNYDRVLEQYLYWALQQDFGISAEVAAKCLSPERLKIFRPYGSVGPLDWQEPGGVAFGGEPSDLVSLATRIRTYTEEANSNDISKLKSEIEMASAIVFLGFGFHKQNIDLLTLSGAEAPRQIFMTVRGIFSQNHAALAGEIQRILQSGTWPNYFDLTAAESLVQLRQSIVMATS